MNKRAKQAFFQTMPNLIIVLLALIFAFYTNTFDLDLKVLLLLPIVYIILFLYYYTKLRQISSKYENKSIFKTNVFKVYILRKYTVV